MEYECVNPECKYHGKRFDQQELTQRQCNERGCEFPVIDECPGCGCDLEEAK